MTSKEVLFHSKLDRFDEVDDFWVILRGCDEFGWIDPTTANELGPECLARV